MKKLYKYSGFSSRGWSGQTEERAGVVEVQKALTEAKVGSPRVGKWEAEKMRGCH